MIFRQLFDRETCTYTFIVGDKESKKAVIIDPVIELIDRDLRLLDQLSLSVTHVLETHTHADHITGAGRVREKTGASICVSQQSGVKNADRYVKNGDQISIGKMNLTVLETPGHTSDSLCFLTSGMVFTGDTLFIRGCGRTDFQNGSSTTLYHSVQSQLFSLPGETLVYPGHDYKGETVSTIAEEKAFNPRLSLSEKEFVELMDNLNLPNPKKIDEAVPANLNCGLLSA